MGNSFLILKHDINSYIKENTFYTVFTVSFCQVAVSAPACMGCCDVEVGTSQQQMLDAKNILTCTSDHKQRCVFMCMYI